MAICHILLNLNTLRRLSKALSAFAWKEKYKILLYKLNQSYYYR